MAIGTNRYQISFWIYYITLSDFRKRLYMVNVDIPNANIAINIREFHFTNLAI